MSQEKSDNQPQEAVEPIREQDLESRRVGRDKRRSAEKSQIHPHRSYRKLVEASKGYLMLQFLLLSIPLMVLVYLLFPYLTFLNCYNAYHLLSSIIPEEFIHILGQDYLGSAVHLMSIPAVYPSREFSFVVALISFILLILLGLQKRVIPKSIALWLGFMMFTNLVSASFFFFFPNHFPYSIKVFSELYMKTEVSMWLILPPLIAISLLPLPARLLTKFSVILAIFILDVILGIVRYVAFLYILHEYSFLWMAVMFFTFGPLVDFLYAVVTYTIYMRYISGRIGKDLRLWKWSY